jgi:acetyl esterase/lipase
VGCGGKQPLSLSEDPAANAVWLPAVPENYILGTVKDRAEATQITSISVPGYWAHENGDIRLEGPASTGEKVILHIHGGAFVDHLPPPEPYVCGIPKELVRRSPSFRRALAVRYRWSTAHPLPPRNQFPAALIDVLAAYVYLVKMGFEEKNITIIGESAGGNLALALVRYLVEHRTDSPLPAPPGALVVLSAWVDVGESFRKNDDPNSSGNRFRAYDALDLERSILLYGAKAISGPGSEGEQDARLNPYISPASPEVLGLTGNPRTVSFRGFPRTWIDIGGFEVFLDQTRRLRDVMIEELGDEMVHYNEKAGAIHDYAALESNEPDGTETLIELTEWLEG